jgi:hypothetical protein
MNIRQLIIAVIVGLVEHQGITAPMSTNSFGIYLFAESVDWRDNATNWTTRKLSAKPVISEADIVTYSFTNHLVTLTPEAAKRITEFHIPKLVEPFVVVANGERIYRGAFVLSICSQSVALPSITLWGGQQFTIYTNLPPNSLFIGRTYAAPFSDAERDPRSDERIRRALRTLHKLK